MATSTVSATGPPTTPLSGNASEVKALKICTYISIAVSLALLLYLFIRFRKAEPTWFAHKLGLVLAVSSLGFGSYGIIDATVQEGQQKAVKTWPMYASFVPYAAALVIVLVAAGAH